MAIFVDDLSMPAVNEWGDQVHHSHFMHISWPFFFELFSYLSNLCSCEGPLLTVGAGDVQVTNEIVRQLLDQGGMYSLEKPIGDMRYIVDTRQARWPRVLSSEQRIAYGRSTCAAQQLHCIPLD